MLAASWIPSWLVDPMTALLTWFLQVSGNYGIAIILLTIVVRILILPLTIYQTKSMKRMQEVQPRMKELQTKYKDNPEKLNQEMMTLYKTEGVNPFAGCLPMLVQLPILWGLFEVFRLFDPVALGYTYQFLWADLSQKDIPLAIMTVVSMFAQSYLSGMTNDPNQKMMTWLLPIMFGWIAFTMPQSGIILYWVVSTVFGLIQQAIYPGFPRLKGVSGAKGEA
ncbi:MAG: YidC/Oxa1 family membrane protein insertase [Bacillota bacterium]